MNTRAAINNMLAGSGMTHSAASVALGRKRNYIMTTISRGSTPRADTLARIARVCGYRLVLLPEESSIMGDYIEIDPPENET